MLSFNIWLFIKQQTQHQSYIHNQSHISFLNLDNVLFLQNLAENNIKVPGLKAIVPAIIDNILITKLDLSGKSQNSISQVNYKKTISRVNHKSRYFR